MPTAVCPALLISLGCLLACNLETASLPPCGRPSTLDEPPPDQLDLLFMVDNSSCMTMDQRRLVDAIPELLRTLLRGELTATDGSPERSVPALRSIRIAFVSSDMGAGGFELATTCVARGDDGHFLALPSPVRPGCRDDVPLFLELTRAAEASDAAWAAQVEDLALDAACMAPLGTGGCGFEQPLEAVLKALTPPTSSLRFEDGTRGQGDANRVEGLDPAGFLRPDSVLAIIALTDEDDCSVADPELFDPRSERYPGDLNLRCFHYPEAVHPVERYVEGLLALRPPEHLVYATLAGVPEHLSGADARMILEDPAMQEVVDPANGTSLLPSCRLPGTLSFPPRRLVSLAADLDARGAHVAVASLCQPSFVPALAPITTAIADALVDAPGGGPTCL